MHTIPIEFAAAPVLWWRRPPADSGSHREPVTTPDQEAQEDQRLMQAVAGGDEPALRRLMDRHLAKVLALAQRILGDADEADDVAQEAFTRVWRNARGFDGGRARFTTWLYRIAFNLCLDRRRARRGEWQPLHEDLADASPGPGEVEERRQLRQQLTAGLARLSPQELRILLLLRDGGRNRQIAEALAISESTVKSHISAILHKLGLYSRTQAALVAQRLLSSPAADPAT